MASIKIWTADGWKYVTSKGDKGDKGEGVPAGGTPGQLLSKKTAADYDVEWIAALAGGGVDIPIGETPPVNSDFWIDTSVPGYVPEEGLIIPNLTSIPNAPVSGAKLFMYNQKIMLLFNNNAISILATRGVDSPLDITNCIAWYSSSHITGKNNGDLIPQWDDLSGNSNHLVQATADYQPTYTINSINNLPAIRFDGANDRLMKAFALSTPCTILCIVNMVSLQSYSSVYDGVNNNTMNMAGINGNTFSLFTNNFWGYLPAVTNKWYLHTLQARTTEASTVEVLSYSGEYNSTLGGSYSVNIGGLRVGCGDNEGENGNMYLAELIVYNRNLTSEELKSLKAYIISKYAFTV